MSVLAVWVTVRAGAVSLSEEPLEEPRTGSEANDTGGAQGAGGLDWLLRWLEGEPGKAPEDVDISDPGPDLANFPNSSFTLRKGEFYFESTPVNVNGPGEISPFNYNWELFLRYGLTENVEARFYTSGMAFEGGDQAALGFSPLTFDTKMHFTGSRLRVLQLFRRPGSVCADDLAGLAGMQRWDPIFGDCSVRPSLTVGLNPSNGIWASSEVPIWKEGMFFCRVSSGPCSET